MEWAGTFIEWNKARRRGWRFRVHKVWFREMGVETGVDEGDFFCASGISV